MYRRYWSSLTDSGIITSYFCISDFNNFHYVNSSKWNCFLRVLIIIMHSLKKIMTQDTTQDWDLPCKLMVRAKVLCEDNVQFTLFLCPQSLSVVSQSEKLFWQLQPIFHLKLDSFLSFLLRINLSCTMFQFWTWLWVTWQLCQMLRREWVHSLSAPLHLQTVCTL